MALTSERAGGGPWCPREFEITGEPLGEGGSAVVWPARLVVDGREVALKIWKDKLAVGEQGRFVSEVRHHRRISAGSPYVVRYELAGIRDPRPWLATERFGASLDRTLSEHRLVPLSEAAAIGHDMLAGLAAVHAAGAVHRDLKPGNVVVRNGRAKLCDLGLVMQADAYTRDKQAGTTRYVAPELFDDASPDTRSDVYSAAVTLRALLPSPPPEPLAQVLRRAISPVPLKRPADGAELLDVYRRACSEAGIELPEHPPSDDEREAVGDAHFLKGLNLLVDDDGAPVQAKRPNWLALVVAAIAIAATAGGVAVMERQRDGDAGAAPATEASEVASPGASNPTASRAVVAVREYEQGLPETGPGRSKGRCQTNPGMHQVASPAYGADDEPGSRPLARVSLLWDAAAGQACAKLIKAETSDLYDVQTRLALSMCGAPGQCDSDRSLYFIDAGPVRVEAPDGCIAWIISVRDEADTQWLIQDRADQHGCS